MAQIPIVECILTSFQMWADDEILQIYDFIYQSYLKIHPWSKLSILTYL